MYVLGIWDGHDAGAALINGERVVFAINEERLSRRKLDVGFPRLSIRACLDAEGLLPKDVTEIGVSTGDPAKTLTRLIPQLKEEYYLHRRRKKDLSGLVPLKRWFKYWFTAFRPNRLTWALSRSHLNGQIREMGFRDYRLDIVDHHKCHAHTAARCSGFGECAVLTLDGVGDGLSGSLWHLANGILSPVKEMPARVSLGTFFEHITNLMNMRELEDEGKVMALANYAYPVPDDRNPLMGLLKTEGLDLVSEHGPYALYGRLKKILWRYPSEQFAYMAQRTLEKYGLELIQESCRVTGTRRVAVAGGVFSNIKLNMKAAELDGVEEIFVFPNMGDGGLALGAAMDVNERRAGIHEYGVADVFFGPQYSKDDVQKAIEATGFSFSKPADVARTAADLILAGEIVLWFRGRMEYGPRSLGNRSILARPDDRRIKDQLNLVQKKRVWYQPFCPSILMEDAPLVLDLSGPGDVQANRFMTTAFRVRQDYLDLMEGVINIDGTCRPHLVGDENPVYRQLLLEIQKVMGKGVVLNTSFNIHGEPVVCSPEDALHMFERTAIRYLFIEDFLVEKQE